MTITVAPGTKIEQQFGDMPSLLEEYYVFNTTDRIAARQELVVYLQANPNPDGLLLTYIRLADFSDDSWVFDVTWGIKRLPKEGEIRLMVDGEGGREKITQALSVVGAYAEPGQTAPESNGVIGLESDGTINGVEIEVSGATIFVEFHVDASLISFAYLARIARLSKKVNVAPWKGFAAGELRFKKYTFEETIKLDEDGTQLAKLTLEFVFEENATGITIGNITPFAKDGHDYVWVYYVEITDGLTPPKVIIKKPKYAFVDRVYPRDDFKKFGIG